LIEIFEVITLKYDTQLKYWARKKHRKLFFKKEPFENILKRLIRKNILNRSE